MEQPDWAKILKHLHNSNGEFRRSAQPENHDKEPSNEEHEQALYDALGEEIDLASTENDHIIETHKHLQNTGLVNFQQTSDYAALKLTPDGFDVAHERELSQRNNSINYSLVFLTFILVLAQIIGVIPVRDWVKVISALILLVGMLVIIYMTDLLER